MNPTNVELTGSTKREKNKMVNCNECRNKDCLHTGENNVVNCEDFRQFISPTSGKSGSVPSSMRPTIICLCGSTRFKDAYEKANREETLKGNIVLSVGLFGHVEGLDMDGDTKAMLDELHLAKIDLADEVLILNVDGYIGKSTRNELCYARNHGKVVRSLEPLA